MSSRYTTCLLLTSKTILWDHIYSVYRTDSDRHIYARKSAERYGINKIQNQQDCLFITVTNYGESSIIQIPFLQSMTRE